MAQQPNFLFILLDDYGWVDTGCYGSSFYETPNLDRLAREGMRFTDAYAACPVCSPTRASIMSGKYPANVGVTDWIDWGGRLHPARGRVIDAPYINHLPETETSIATALRDGGYQTWHVGKWHLGGEQWYPDRHGFDVNVAGCEAGSPGGGNGYFAPWSIPLLRDVDVLEGTYLTDYLTDRAIDLVRNRDRSKPFFLNYWPYAVHTPLQAPQHLVEKYEKKARDLHLDKVEAVVEGEAFPSEHKKHLRVQRRVIQSHATYAAMVENTDRCIGRLLDTLREEGMLDDTAVFFTSDNGGLSTSEGSPTCNLPLAEGKGWMYEGGVRDPLIVRYPKLVAAGSTCAEPVTSPDFYPTMLELAGLDAMPQQHEDGVSLTGLLKGEPSLDREAIYWHYPHYGNQGGTPGCSIRSGDWKLIEFYEDGRLELYHLRDDVSETRNLADAEPERTTHLHGLLKAWRDRMNAKIPATNPDWEPDEWSDARV